VLSCLCLLYSDLNIVSMTVSCELSIVTDSLRLELFRSMHVNYRYIHLIALLILTNFLPKTILFSEMLQNSELSLITHTIGSFVSHQTKKKREKGKRR